MTAVLEPGTTADTLVPVPDDGTTAFTLYESGQHLDTAVSRPARPPRGSPSAG